MKLLVVGLAKRSYDQLELVLPYINSSMKR